MFGVHNSSYRFFFCDKKRPTEISRVSFKKNVFYNVHTILMYQLVYSRYI